MQGMLISKETFDNVLFVASKNEVEYEMIEGVLNENYFFFDMEDSGVTVSKKPYRFIAIVHEPVNEWEDRLAMYMTDCEKEFATFINLKKINYRSDQNEYDEN